MTQFQGAGAPDGESILHSTNPAMFRNSPIKFIFFIALIPLCGLGILLLLLWWLDCLGTTLTVTDRRTILRRGVLSKYTTEVLHEHVRNIQVGQSFFQRMMGVGDFGISSSGQAGIEISVSGIPSPEQVKQQIDNYRYAPRSTPAQAAWAPSPPPVVTVPRPVPKGPADAIAEAPERSSVASERFKVAAQTVLDRATYVASLRWVAGLPDWAQPIVWGLIVAVPFVLMLILTFRVLGR